MISLALTMLAADATPSAVPDGTLLPIGKACYALTAGGKAIGASYQSVMPAKAPDGTDALAIVVHQRLSNGRFDMRDAFLVRRSDLRPISLANSRDGKPHVQLTYRDGRVLGWKEDKAGRVEVDQALAGPVWDGNLWGAAFAALPLAPKAQFTLPFYQYDRGLGTFAVAVTGEETVATPQGPRPAWIVKAGVQGQPAAEYLIAKADRQELGYRAGPTAQLLGGDCTGIE
jgi:hypothetical protein